MKIDDKELLNVIGGGISATILSYFATAVKTVYSVGQGLGGAIRRIAKRDLCPLR